MSSATPVHERGPAVAVLLRTLATWGKRPRLRLLLYALALGGLSVTPAQDYTGALAWADSAMGPPGTATPSGTLVWFRVRGDVLEPLDGPAEGPHTVGLDFYNASTRIEPPGRELAFRAVRIWLARAAWADPTQQPPPDPERMARLLSAQLWIEGDPAPTFTALGGGVYEARYKSAPGVRAFARAVAWPATRTALLLAGIALLAGEGLALLGRRAVPIRPGECESCGYPLADLPSERCPECGSPRARDEGTDAPA
ncbi:MAG: zinc ribbon domain-containing protein [Phycisphaerales bacterium JB041]